jgi:two-component system chemotaxis response regulator CheB
MSDSKIRVLVIDDSAFARKVIREVLEKDPEIEVVGIARDGLEALEKIAELKPDVITLDLVMPDLDGIGVLQALPLESRPRVIVVSVSGAESELVLEALNLGAVDVVTKPTAFPTDRLYDLSSELSKKVKEAATAKPRTLQDSREKVSTHKIFLSKPFTGPARLVVLGTSTGGPQAITELFKVLPANFPVPLVIALHIPSGYTGPLAERISKFSALKLVEAVEGMELVPNQAVIAQGGMHLKIKEVDGKLFAVVTREPFDSLFHPSVDLLFETAAVATQGDLIGVVLTGMGSDGTEGAKRIRKLGGKVLVQSEPSCVVYGMPRSVKESGSANEEASLDQIPDLILRYLSVEPT